MYTSSYLLHILYHRIKLNRTFTENAGSIFGQKFWESRHTCAIQVQLKSDRWETRFLSIAKFRVFLLHGKCVSNLKIERSFNILALRHLELTHGDQMVS